ncbi:MAG: hypothetical protein DYH15_14945 [Nitrosomonas sp. PRO4]|nr:hypothetical protein [Nitrosomonas sp. PRO4]
MGRAKADKRPGFSRGSRWNGVTRLKKGLYPRPKGMDLADIVDQGEQTPLYIHFTFDRLQDIDGFRAVS